MKDIKTIDTIVDGNIHVMPDWEDHEESKDCWCHPRFIYKDQVTNIEVWSHNQAGIN